MQRTGHRYFIGLLLYVGYV